MRAISDLINLSGRRAVITGANGHIGRQMAITIAELGGSLILVDRLGADFSSLCEELTLINDNNILCFGCDLEDEISRADLVNKVLNLGGPIHVLINNAAFVGTSELTGWVDDLEGQTIATWRRAIEVNLTAAFDLSKGFAPKLKEGKNGSIINVSSIYGFLGPDYSLYEGTDMGNPAAYAVSKAGLIQLTRWLATTLASDIRVNALSPGGLFNNQDECFVNRYNQRTPLKRMATAEDMKGAVAYLASDLSAYVTGHNLIVDGGWSVW